MNKPVLIPEPNSQPRPCILPGLASLKKQLPLALQVCNRMDWGPNNLVAYASQNLVVISDPYSVQHLITLHGHKYPVTAVRWYQHEGFREFREEANRLLVSGDDHGYLVFWNVQKGRKVYAFLDEGGEVLQIRILNNCVLSLSNRSMLSCWSLSQKKRTWRIDLGERDVFSFSIDPFTKSTIILACQSGWILSLQNVMTDHRPRTVQKRFRLTSRTPNQKFSGLFLRDIIHSPHKKGQYYLVTANEVAIFDDTIEKALSVRKLQYMRSEFVKLFVYDDLDDELYSLHGDGSVVFWKWEPSRRKYLMKRLDHVVRSGKISKEKAGSVYGLSFSRYYNNQFAVTDTCGKLWVWKYRRSKKKWMMKGILESINSLITTMKIRDNLMAIGTISGTIIIYDLLKCDVMLRYSLFSSSIKGIVWVGDELVVYSSSTKKSGSSDYIPNQMTSPTKEGVVARGRRNSGMTGDGKSNELVILNLKHGKTRHFRRPQEREKAVVLAATVSDSQRYLLLILKDKPIELWNLRTLVLLKVLKIRQVMTVTWCPQSRKQKLRKSVPEQFILSKQGGHLSFYLVTEQPTKRKTEVVEIQKKRFSTYTSISAVARKDAYLVCGDVEGNLLVIARNKETKTIATHRGYIRRILFSPLQNLIAVLFVDGGFAVYNLATSQRIATSPKYIRSVSVEWTSNDLLAIASVTGIVYVFDTTLTHASSSFLKHSIDFPLMSPALLPKPSLLHLKHSMLLNLISKSKMEPFHIQVRQTTPGIVQSGNAQTDTLESSDLSDQASQHIIYYKNCFGEKIPILDPSASSKRHPINVRITIHPSLHEQLVPDKIKKRLRCEVPAPLSLPKRALLVSKFFGDNLGWRFWALVQKYLPDLVRGKDEILDHVSENEKKKKKADPLEERPPSGSPPLPIVEEIKSHSRSQSLPSPQNTLKSGDALPVPSLLQNLPKTTTTTTTTPTTTESEPKQNNNVVVVVEEEEDEEDESVVEEEEEGFVVGEDDDSGITELEYTHPQKPSDDIPFPLSGLFSIFRPRHQVSYEEHVNVGNYDQTIREGRSRDLIKIVGTHEALLGRKDDAVSLLVETPSSHGDMVANFLHACVISASNSQEHFKQTVLLVSSNLFSFGSLDNQKTKEYIFLGVELLCLIGEGLKACKVLQNFEFWDDAARIAKTTLRRDDCNNILARWALHLERSKKFMDAISVWLSLGCTYNCVKLLHDLGLSDVAYLFVRSCMEVGFPLLTNARATSILDDGALEYPPDQERDLLLKKVMHRYKMFLKDVGLDGKLENLKLDREKEGEKEEEEMEGEQNDDDEIENIKNDETGVEEEIVHNRKKKEEEKEEVKVGEDGTVVDNLLNFGD